ncbi:hypothetical protein McanMca71_005427 [Microsporum canis]
MQRVPDVSGVYTETSNPQVDQLESTQPIVYPDDLIPFSAFTNISPSCTSCKTPDAVPSDQNHPMDLLTQAVAINSLNSKDAICTSSVHPSVFSKPFGDSITSQQLPISYGIGQPMGATEKQPSDAPEALLQELPSLGPLGHFPNAAYNLQSRYGAPGTTSDYCRGSESPIDDCDFGDNFRFHSILHAATAMVQCPDDIPTTYLNKGQIYTLTITDTGASNFDYYPLKYRTTIRITFEEEKQRLKPASYWKLWQEGRSANGTYQGDSTPLAVEHVDHNQGDEGKPRYRQVQLERNNLDGFSVIWTPRRTSGPLECAIYVRFNFVSTSFSYSKGVKGVPLRLCTKTEAILSPPEIPGTNYSEISYCKVKLFRDHGAERKLSNDLIHVKKLIHDVKEEISETSSGSMNCGKKRRYSSSVLGNGDGHMVKTRKSKGPWSYGQDVSMKGSLEEDLRIELNRLKEMITSRREASVLNLKGDLQDDPDLFPLELDVQQNDDDILGKEPLMENRAVSIKPQKHCFYVQKRQNNKKTTGEYFHAIYIEELTAKAFTDALVKKWKLKSANTIHTLFIRDDGLTIVADDRAVQELPEGKGILFDFLETAEESLGVEMELYPDSVIRN